MMFTPTAIPNKSPDVNSEKALLSEFDKKLNTTHFLKQSKLNLLLIFLTYFYLSLK